MNRTHEEDAYEEVEDEDEDSSSDDDVDYRTPYDDVVSYRRRVSVSNLVGSCLSLISCVRRTLVELLMRCVEG